MITNTIVTLLLAIRIVESCDGLDKRAKGNDYQITKICVDDVNRIYGTKYVYPKDTRNRETAEDIVMLYLTWYGYKYYEEYHKIPTAETIAKIYHCGYAGMKRGDERGEKYWKKIQTTGRAK